MFVEILLCARVCGEGGTPLKARKQTISPPGRQAYPRFPHAFVGSRSGMGDLPGQVETCSRLGSSKHPNTNGVYVTTVQRALAGVSRPIHFLFFFALVHHVVSMCFVYAVSIQGAGGFHGQWLVRSL